MIYQIDEFLTEETFSRVLDKCSDYSTNPEYPGWKFTGRSIENNRPFWYIDVKNDYFFESFIGNAIIKSVKEFANEEIDEIYRIYLNGATFGQQGYWHTDGDHPKERTLLIYACREWEEEWGGATVFKPHGSNEVVTSFPKPRKAVYFDGSMPHFSQQLSKDFHSLRITVAYKMRIK